MILWLTDLKCLHAEATDVSNDINESNRGLGFPFEVLHFWLDYNTCTHDVSNIIVSSYFCTGFRAAISAAVNAANVKIHHYSAAAAGC